MKIFYSFLLLFFLCGCASVKVVDNTYVSANGRSYQVVSEYVYAGVVEDSSAGQAYHYGIRQDYNRDYSTRRFDLFVKSDNGVLVDGFVFMERRTIRGAYKWAPVKGDTVEFGDDVFVEGVYTFSEKDFDSSKYLSYMDSKGFSLSLDEGVYCYMIVKNYSGNTKAVLGNCLAKHNIPKGIESRLDLKQHLRAEFEKVIKPID